MVEGDMKGHRVAYVESGGLAILSQDSGRIAARERLWNLGVAVGSDWPPGPILFNNTFTRKTLTGKTRASQYLH